MVADKGKKSKVAERGEEQDSDHVDGELVLSIEKLQELQDELEKVSLLLISCFLPFIFDIVLLILFVSNDGLIWSRCFCVFALSSPLR